VEVLLFILLGLIAGALAGVLGIGGGIIIVPALVYLFSFSQKMAQGTTLALLIPPIGILAAWTYYKAGFVDVRAAGYIIVGFVIGSYFISRYAVSIQDTTLTKVFGVFLLVIAIKMILTK
jgi:uncharacterized protein